MTATQESLSLARDLLVNWFWTVEATEPEPNRLDVTLTAPGDLVPMVVALRVKRLGYLSAITGCDPGPDTGQLEVLYHFCAVAVTCAPATVGVPTFTSPSSATSS